jgi:hypothetical protein
MMSDFKIYKLFGSIAQAYNLYQILFGKDTYSSIQPSALSLSISQLW